MTSQNLKREVIRKFFHMLFGIMLILSILYIPGIKWVLFYLLIAGIIISLLSIYLKIPIVHFLLKNLERPRDLKSFPGKGLLFFLAGALLLLKLFPVEIALASIAILSFSDPFFSIKKRDIKGIFKTKKFTNMLLGFVIAAIAASIFVPIHRALIASVVAVIAESLVIIVGGDPVDDNVIVPLAAGTALYLLAIYGI